VISSVSSFFPFWFCDLPPSFASLVAQWKSCAVLQISMNYTEGYNNIPPCINFITIPFHPNVDPQSGRPCVDFLDDPTMWNSKLTMTSILLSIQVLLSNPVLNNAVNLEAAKMLQDNYPLYRQRVIQCVRTSQYLKGNKLPYTTSRLTTTTTTNINTTLLLYSDLWNWTSSMRWGTKHCALVYIWQKSM
uniref:Ubiquitin conjugating enzyme E2 U n=1 Tax=Varanus komodoensis TaxID=61221 RepID=A0A8D2L1J4_VARKO